jgi:FG-GAP-like repeat/FG-GAP repeat
MSFPSSTKTSMILALLAGAACSSSPASTAPGGPTSGGGSGADGGIVGSDGGGTVGSDGGGIVGSDGGGADGATGPGQVHSSCAPANVAFGVPQHLALKTGNYAQNMSSADFNNDGKADLVVYEPNGIEVFLSTGGGAFGPGKFYDHLDSNEFSMRATQFFGATATIVVPAIDPPGTFDLFTGKGDGTFGSVPTNMPSGSRMPMHMFAADMNNDQKLDLVFDDLDYLQGTGGVALNAGSNFATPIAMALPSEWAVGDLNGDGAADLVSVPPNGNYHGLCVSLNTRTGQFAATPTCMAGPIAGTGIVSKVAVGDVNGDGKLDIAGIWDGSGGVDDTPNFAIYLGKGDGTFGDRNLATLKMDMQGFTLTDVNNDGKADFVILATVNDPKGVHVLLSKGDGTFADAPISLGMGASPTASGVDPIVADFSGDGLRGIAVIGGQTAASTGVDFAIATCKP